MTNKAETLSLIVFCSLEIFISSLRVLCYCITNFFYVLYGWLYKKLVSRLIKNMTSRFARRFCTRHENLFFHHWNNSCKLFGSACKLQKVQNMMAETENKTCLWVQIRRHVYCLLTDIYVFSFLFFLCCVFRSNMCEKIFSLSAY